LVMKTEPDRDDSPIIIFRDAETAPELKKNDGNGKK
jgi:hypothetical protein